MARSKKMVLLWVYQKFKRDFERDRPPGLPAGGDTDRNKTREQGVRDSKTLSGLMDP